MGGPPLLTWFRIEYQAPANLSWRTALKDGKPNQFFTYGEAQQWTGELKAEKTRIVKVTEEVVG